MDKKDIEKLATEFINKFDSSAKVEVAEDNGWRVKISSENSGHLIGKMGETLAEIQYLMRLMVAQKAGEYIPVTVDVDGYKEKHETELAELALAMAENVKSSGYPQEMRPMSSYDRRLVHVALKDMPGIKADSVGEGELRRIKIEKTE
jgi:spoIIIJ-associated protein